MVTMMTPSQMVPAGTADLGNTVADWPGDRAVCRPVPMAHVEVSGFLGARIDRNLDSVLKGLDSPIPKGFEARAKGEDLPEECNRLAADSDLYKWLEGACYVYARTKNQELRKEVDRIADLILKCQKEDGYINTQVPPKERFDLKVNHDLYIAGHFFEASVAHYRATGERRLLDAACRWADYLIGEYEKHNPYYRRVGEKEHSEYELGFLRLARATGKKEYVDFAITLAKMCRLGPNVADVRAGGGLHAVRVGYLLAGCSDLFLETGREDLFRYVPGLWDEIANTRLYVTGGMGAREYISRKPYELPQCTDERDRDIAETCGSVAMMMFSWRMHSISGKSRCFDAIENILYNHYLGAIAADNLGTFYYNPLRVVGDQSGDTDAGGPKTTRTMLPEMHRTACCITNSWRFFGALPEYVFSYDEKGLYINLYTSSRVRQELPNGAKVALAIETEYPCDGKIAVRFEGEKPAEFSLHLRIPVWCFRAKASCAGVDRQVVGGGDYLTLERKWQPGDEVELVLDMPVRMVFSDPRIEANSGQVALARGPLVYCLENVDNDFPVEQACLSLRPEDIEDRVQVEWKEDVLGGLNMLHVPGTIAPTEQQKENMQPYFTPGQPVRLTLVPFYARANRGSDNRWVTLLPLVQGMGKTVLMQSLR